MGQYDKILSYLDYFQKAGEEAGTWVHREGYFSYVDYVQEFLNFHDEVYKTDLIDTKYLEHLEEYFTQKQDIASYINTADMDLLKSILTYYIRGDRFCEGLWLSAIIDKAFLRILLRLKELTQPTC